MEEGSENENTRYMPDVQVTYEEDGNYIHDSEDKVAQLIRLLSASEAPEQQQNSSASSLPIDRKWQTVKRRRKRQPVAIDDPRKFFSDNSIAAMLSGDINQYREVVERQHTSDCVWIQRHTNDTPEHPAYRELRGRDKMIEFVGALMDVNPDMVVHVSERKLHICEDGSSYLVSKGTYSAMNVSSLKFTNMVKRTRKFLSSINPLGALRSFFYGGGLHYRHSYQQQSSNPDSAADQHTSVRHSPVEEESIATATANKSAKDRPKFSPSITSDHRPNSPPVSSASASTSFKTEMQAVESNSEVSTPQTQIVVVYDKEYTPSGVYAVISTVAFINPEFKIYKVEQFIKVEFTRFLLPWSTGLRTQGRNK